MTNNSIMENIYVSLFLIPGGRGRGMSTLFPTTDSPKQKSNEWYTPARYVEAARKVMGSIDLDPASCELANRTVKATRYYTEQENGLVQPWYGNVWLNPPYGKTVPYNIEGRFRGGGSDNARIKTLQVLFTHKAIEEYKASRIKQAVLLVTANITLTWFQPLWNYLICTPYPKISFHVEGMAERQRQVFGNVFVYLGPNESKFIQVFSQFGRIARAVDTPRPQPYNLSLWNEEHPA